MIFSIHEHELKPRVDVGQYERDIGQILATLVIPGLIAAHHLKGFKGERDCRYSVLWMWESAEVVALNFGTLKNPRWPEQWLFYENEILAKYLTCHPDKIRFTDYAVVTAQRYA